MRWVPVLVHNYASSRRRTNQHTICITSGKIQMFVWYIIPLVQQQYFPWLNHKNVLFVRFKKKILTSIFRILVKFFISNFELPVLLPNEIRYTKCELYITVHPKLTFIHPGQRELELMKQVTDRWWSQDYKGSSFSNCEMTAPCVTSHLPHATCHLDVKAACGLLQKVNVPRVKDRVMKS